MWRLTILFVLVLLAGCAKNEKVELTISAAASLIDALQELQQVYEKTHENIKLNLNFGSSGALQQQIEQGAPADVFLSASTKNMDALIDKKLIDGSYHTNLLMNKLVVVTSSTNKIIVHSIKDLAQEEIKHFAIGEPSTVPAGSYAKEALSAVNLWDSLEHKMVFGKDVRQVLTYVESGNAEAGIVYKTDARSTSDSVIAFEVDSATYSTIAYPLGIVTTSKNYKEAIDFFTYLQSREAFDVFDKFGFSIHK